MKQARTGGCPNLAVCPNIPDFTLTYIVYVSSECPVH